MERSFPTLLLTDGAVYRDVLPLVLGEFLRLVPAPGESGFVGVGAEGLFLEELRFQEAERERLIPATVSARNFLEEARAAAASGDALQ